MPRPNQPRSLRSERELARRIAHERARSGMSYEGLAQRMTDAGCPINGSAIYKIEQGDPPRRITVDELVALSLVFGLPLEELLLPPDEILSREAVALVDRWRQLGEQSIDLSQQATQAWRDVLDFAARQEEGPGLEALIARLSEVSGDPPEALRKALAEPSQRKNAANRRPGRTLTGKQIVKERV